MSKKAEIRSSASDAAVHAALTKLSQATGTFSEEELKGIPNIGPDANPATAEDWHTATAQIAKQSIEMDARTDRAAHQTLAMILLDAQLHSSDYYKIKLGAEGRSVPQNQDALTLAVAYHMGIDVGHTDRKTKANNSKTLNRLVSASRQLRVKAPRSTDGKISVPFDPDGVATLMEIIRDQGGINAMMSAYQATNRGRETANLIALDKEAVAELRMQRFSERIKGGEELLVGLVSRQQDNSIALAEEIKLTASLKNAITSQFDLASKEVAFLRELLRVAHCVPEFATAFLVNRYDDPNDTAAPRRRTRRHFVFNPDNTITISQILSEAGVIVTVGPKINLLAMPIEGHVAFRTQQVHEIEANLSGDRASVLDLNIQKVTDTAYGVARLTLSSQAAVTGARGHTTSVSVLVQQLWSKSEVLPLTVSGFKPKHALSDVALLPAWQLIAGRCTDAVKKNKQVTVSVAKGKLVIEVGKETVAVDVPTTAQDFSLQVRADDFVAVAQGLSGVNPVGQFSLGYDPDMLALTFETVAAAYSIHIPKRGIDGTRSNRLITKLEPQVWPGLPRVIDSASEVE